MKTMDIRLKHTDITKAGTDSFERKSVDNSFDIEFDSLYSTPEVSEDIVDKIKNFRRKFLTRISKLVNKP